MPETFWTAAGSAEVAFSIGLTLRVMALAVPLFFVLGVPLGYLLGRGRGRFVALVDVAVSLPLVLPPMAVGFFLLLLLGRNAPIGGVLRETLGVELIFGFPGLVIAAVVAGLPLMVRPVQAAVRGDLLRLIELSSVLGKSAPTTFVRVVLPHCRKSVAAGMFLATGRALGEVGVSLLLGGDIVGRTNTVSLEIYNAVFSGQFARAGFLAALLAGVSLVLTLLLKRTGRG
ncbi:ABC transporter permease subunit [Desulfovibrio aerotolerans]|uniref:ABC transporter permease subunit n=1 Tax=Solidesulfovibrio aerotolerans TaxID=295255 RepID=A0A7C9N613_9BACT|nr:ABC transporter permease subunit [Solidesulfovibrio aerotolerans]MYL83895.1 ABC transporter permease subunit [Solidesulfovibrio aerotolerans]